MMKSRFTIVAAVCIVLTGTGLLNATTPGTANNVQLVGQNPLFGRGMNAAAANYKHYLYVGNRTDGSSRCGFGDPRRANGLDTCSHPHPGILIIDIKNPANPTVVGEIPAPLNPAGQPVGITSREVRVWPEKKLLMTMNFRCSSLLHACPPTNNTTSPFDVKFFSLKDPIHPKFLSHYVPTSNAGVQVEPHEMFLWADPNNEDRALVFFSTPNIFADAVPNLLIVDISQVPSGGSVTEVAEGNWNNRYPGTNDPLTYPFDNNSVDGCGPYDCNLFVHSMSVKPDGALTYLALEAGHFLVLDTSQVAAGVPNPQLVLLTDPANRPVWLQDPLDPAAIPGEFPGGCASQRAVLGILSSQNCPNSHSAVKVPGRNLALTTDEVYGTLTFFNQGCRWGWARLIDISDSSRPVITGEYSIDEDNPLFCGTALDDSVTEFTRSYSSHNPTLTKHLAIIDWHSGGLQIIDTSDPTNPVQAGFYVPDPPASVANEDPGLSQGTASRNNKTVFWSYPIIKDGLIYVIDIRNGLFVFQYTGPHAREVGEIGFLEGNSNLGDAVDLDGGDE
jgi:hypothetical protein